MVNLMRMKLASRKKISETSNLAFERDCICGLHAHVVSAAVQLCSANRP